MRRSLRILWRVFGICGTAWWGLGTAGVAADAATWSERKGEHFVIRYQGDESMARDMLAKAETYYDQLDKVLGFRRYQGFWTWDSRVRIVLFPSREAFVTATGSPEWAAGKAAFTKREIVGYGKADFADSVLPHELTHLLFRDYIGFETEAPLWLDEGLAQWMAPHTQEAATRRVRDLLARNKLMSLRALTSTDIRQEQDPELAAQYYAEAVSLVGFLIADGGSERFVRLCRQLRGGKNLEDALRFTYADSTRSMESLEQAWLQALKEKKK